MVAVNDRKENDLVAFLQVQLAEAINLQDKDLIAQLHETIRCLRQFDNDGWDPVYKKIIKNHLIIIIIIKSHEIFNVPRIRFSE